MAETAAAPEKPAARKSRRPLLMAVVAAVVLGGAGFYLAWSGLILGGDGGEAGSDVAALPDIAFVPINPLLISLGPGTADRHLRLTAQLEVNQTMTEEVTLLMPRILDVMNGYLRAIEPRQFDDPGAMVRMRAQLLRRIQIVTGEGRVRDLLITEFVLN